MLCAVTKWLVSRREDTGRGLPSWAEAHLGRCPSCREFVRLASSWKDRSADLRFFDQAEIARGRRIYVHPATAEQPRPAAVRIRNPIPAAALAIAFAAVILGVVWLALPRTPALPSFDKLIPPEHVSALKEDVAGVESPLRQEMDGLQQKLDAAFNYLVSRLDPGLRQTKEKSLS